MLADRPPTALAPIIGWAVFNTLALLILSWTGFNRTAVTLLCGAGILVGFAGLLQHWRSSAATDRGGPDIPIWSFVAAGLLAVVPTLAVWPKLRGGIILAEPMFDHTKVAIIDDIVRLGLPPGNPFFGGSEIAPSLPYYYLWHFSGALPALLFGASGWEADIALTWFTAFASLSLMLGLAVGLGGRRPAAALVIALSAAGSAYPVLEWVFGPVALHKILSSVPWPQGWSFQASWAPQHLASASCVVAAVVVIARLASSRSWLPVPLLGIIAAAGFESSVWVGGIIFFVSAISIGFFFLLSASDTQARVDFLVKGGAALFLTAVISFPSLHEEYVATAARSLGSPIALRPFPVLSEFVPAEIRKPLNLPAYWIILLGIQLPAVYFIGIAAMRAAVRRTRPPERQLVVALALLAAASFTVPWLFASIIANNDLGWRGVLPGVLVLTVFAAAGLSRWLRPPQRWALTAVICWALGVPGGWLMATENAVGFPSATAAILAETPAMWVSVRRHSAPEERVANNPLFLADTVRWPINISWALFADRRSCFAGWNLARAFVPLPRAEIDRINALFERVFAGNATAQDVSALADQYDCRVIVVTPSDGAWERDPFGVSRRYRLVEEQAGKWRIYRANGRVGDES
ncbi:MAG: hypothetical protein JO358_08120 [Alphaproteobacteria bacterium]|nr:hypothetical protein [Alphaproteobacteria bacterium]